MQISEFYPALDLHTIRAKGQPMFGWPSNPIAGWTERNSMNLA
jgi:hypothetical protein